MNTSTSLLARLEGILHQNMEDLDFGIPEFCENLNISRTHLHRKITALTGLSTSHYIRKLRLEEGKHLLQTTNLLVYEVAYRVGFSDVTYFSTSFSEIYGYPPKIAKTQKVHNF